ncbi:MAG: S9 family peptidase [Chitinophagales bacterium]
MKPPVAAAIPHDMTKHGHTRTDNYFWLREKENQAVIDHLHAENAYLKQETQHLEPLQNTLFEEIKGRIKQNDASCPYHLDNYFYYHRYEKDRNYRILCRKKDSLDAEEEIILDINELAEGQAFYLVRQTAISPSHNLLAYGVDLTGGRVCTIHFKDLRTGETLPFTLNNISHFSWTHTDELLFFAVYDQALRTNKIFKYQVGTSQDTAQIVYSEDDETFNCAVSRSTDKKCMFLYSSSRNSTEFSFILTENIDAMPQVICPRREKLEYSVDYFNNAFYIRTNFQAQNFQIMRTPVGSSVPENWETLLPHDKATLITDFTLFNDFWVIEEFRNGLPQIRVKSWDGKTDYYISFKDPTYNAWVGANYQRNSQKLRFLYESLTTPGSIIEFDMVSQTQVLLKQNEVVGYFSSDDYCSERIWATANDGTKVPMSIVYHKDTVLDGQAPLLLYAYGSYGLSMSPYFSSIRLSLLNRGVVYAIAHIRGGQEMGRQWYEDGKFLNKKNTFTDFIACAKHLIAQKYTNSSKLAIMGGSAGGLLMGAVMNLRPDLFKVVVASVPFVDVITTMLDETIPLTVGEYKEWGNPNEEKYYRYMLSYSPYDQVEAKAYPTLLVIAGLHDTQVHYWEPAKWVAKLREMKTDDNLLVLKTNMEAGHGGASGRYDSFKETALEYAFILDQVGITG